MTEKLIKDFLNSSEFGDGKMSLNAYNTAWVARIKDNENGQAFPQASEYLRKTQIKDGSFGSVHPFCLFERMISTLITIISFKQWNYDKDLKRIEKGKEFIEKNLENLELQFNPHGNNDKMTVGFELMFPVLYDEAKQMGIFHSDHRAVDVYRKKREHKLQKIAKCEMAKDKFKGTKSWYYSLEGIGSLYSDEQIMKMVSENGLICASYGATAYALFRDINIEPSFQKIENIVKENEGGIPSSNNTTIFDLSWSLSWLIFAGHPLSDADYKPHLDKLEQEWNNSDGMVGGGEGLPADADDIANSLFVLTKHGILKDDKALTSLLRFNRGDYFIAYEAETQPSLSTNINCLIALKEYEKLDGVSLIINKLMEWIKKKIIGTSYCFDDKWHLSKYYCMTKALIAFEKYNLEFCRKIIEIIIDEQQNDGGWGIGGRTSKLESSYVIISVTYLLKTHPELIDEKILELIRKASNFMNVEKNESEYHFWITTATYSLINMDKMSILSAKFALENSSFI